jgi:type IV pilus assembly protein PilC
MVITCLSIAMIFVFMIYVIPKITDMYKDAKVNLPNLTQNVIDISNFIQNNIFLLIILIILVIFSIITFKNYPKTKIYFDKAILNIPIF